jgi:hypothetical protein
MRGNGAGAGRTVRRRWTKRFLNMTCILVHIFLGSKFLRRNFL